jgi:hypothetical protein
VTLAALKALADDGEIEREEGRRCAGQVQPGSEQAESDVGLSGRRQHEPNHRSQSPRYRRFSDVPVIDLFVKVGDTIKVDDAIVTLESDKATMDVPSTVAGVVKEVLVSSVPRSAKVLC